MSSWSVPRMWDGETVFCLGGGPSLRAVDPASLVGRNLIAINNAYQRFPLAAILYFCDHRWWSWHKDDPAFQSFAGRKVTISSLLIQQPDIFVLKQSTTDGLSLDPHELRTGGNSGYQAINLAVLLGARRVVLLGYDMRMVNGHKHWHAEHPYKTHDDVWERVMLPHFPSLLEPCRQLGVEVINATPDSALTVFPFCALEEVLNGASSK